MADVNVKQLVELVELLVKKEVKAQLPILLKEHLSKQQAQRLVETKKPQVPQRPAPVNYRETLKNGIDSKFKKLLEGEDVDITPHTQQRRPQQNSVVYSDNPVFNDILNETARTPKLQGPIDLHGMVGFDGEFQEPKTVIPPPEPGCEEVVQGVQNIINMDFSKVMKVMKSIDKAKAKGVVPGGLPPQVSFEG